MLQKPAPEIGCTTFNVVDCLRDPTLEVAHRHEKLAPESGVEVMEPISGACERGEPEIVSALRHYHGDG